MFIKEVLTHFKDRNGDMEGKSTWCKSFGRAGNRKELEKCSEETDLFLPIELVSPAPKITVTVVLNTLKSTVPYLAQKKVLYFTVLRLRGKKIVC